MLLGDDLLGFSLNFFSLDSTLLSELGLQVLEQSRGGDLHILNFTSLQPHSPPSENLLHLLINSISDLLPVLEDVIDGEIGDIVSHNGDSDALQLSVGNSWHWLVKVLAKGLVASEGSIFLSVNAPDEHARDFNTLHLSCDLLSFEVHLVHQTRKGDDLVARHGPRCHTNTLLHHFSISYQEKPVLSLRSVVIRLDCLQSNHTSQTHENEREENRQVPDQHDNNILVATTGSCITCIFLRSHIFTILSLN